MTGLAVGVGVAGTGVGVGGGISYDPKGTSPGYDKNNKAYDDGRDSIGYGMCFDAGVSLGPIGIGISHTSGTNHTGGKEIPHSGGGPTVGVSPSWGIGIGVHGNIYFTLF